MTSAALLDTIACVILVQTDGRTDFVVAKTRVSYANSQHNQLPILTSIILAGKIF